jgi:hypothetical protein
LRSSILYILKTIHSFILWENINYRNTCISSMECFVSKQYINFGQYYASLCEKRLSVIGLNVQLPPPSKCSSTWWYCLRLSLCPTLSNVIPNSLHLTYILCSASKPIWLVASSKAVIFKKKNINKLYMNFLWIQIYSLITCTQECVINI